MPEGNADGRGAYREGGGDRAARTLVADRTIHRQAFSGPLMDGGGRSLAPVCDSPAECVRAPWWRCPAIPVLFAWIAPVGVARVASSEFGLNPGSSWVDDTSNFAFAATDPVEAGKEPPDTSRLGKTPCASGACADGTAGAEALAGWDTSVSAVKGAAFLFGDGTRSEDRGSISTTRSRASGPEISFAPG